MAIDNTSATRSGKRLDVCCRRAVGIPRAASARTPSGPVLALILAVLVLAACGGPGDPAARVTVESSIVRLPYPGTAEVPVTWTPLVALEEPIVFVHLWDGQGRLLRTFDHSFPGSWQVGEDVSYDVELWQSALGPPLPPGSYELALGVTAQGERPPLVIGGTEIDRGEYVVTRVEVPPPGGGGPRLRLAEGWELPGAESDRQILGGRWLHKSGRMTVEGMTAPLDVALRLRIPPADQMTHMLIFDDGVTTPGVRIASPCSPVTRVITGFGPHEVIVPLKPRGVAKDPGDESGEETGDESGEESGEEAVGEPDAAASGGDCTIELSADFAYLDPASLQRLSANLMRVEWSPGSPSPAGAADGR